MQTVYPMTKRNLLAAGLSVWLLGGAAQVDRGFTIAVIPDTQNYVDYKHQTAEGFPFDASEMFLEQMRYIAANLESAGGDIAFVTAVGDIWQHQTLAMDPDHAARGMKPVANPHYEAAVGLPTQKTVTIEMPLVKKGYDLLKDKVPFSVVPGNHDYDAVWTDSRFPPAPVFRTFHDWGMLHVGGLSNFNSVFGPQSDFFRGKRWYIGASETGGDSAQVFEAGGTRFLHIGFQYDPPNASLAWAASVIGRFPNLPTIISTHNYLSPRGERENTPAGDSHAVDPEDNSPQMVWEKFVSQHDQIFMVLCGHQYPQGSRIEKNRFGHVVHQLLSDYQNRQQTAKEFGVKNLNGIGDGWMRLMMFDMSGPVPTVRVRTYSTHYKKFSTEMPEYAAWYKADEKPLMTDEEFHRQDDFMLELTDFRERFDKQAKP